MTRHSTGCSDIFKATKIAYKWLDELETNGKITSTIAPPHTKKKRTLPIHQGKEDFFYSLYNSDISDDDAKKIVKFLEQKNIITNTVFSNSQSSITIKDFFKIGRASCRERVCKDVSRRTVAACTNQN